MNSTANNQASGFKCSKFSGESQTLSDLIRALPFTRAPRQAASVQLSGPLWWVPAVARYRAVPGSHRSDGGGLRKTAHLSMTREQLPIQSFMPSALSFPIFPSYLSRHAPHHPPITPQSHPSHPPPDYPPIPSRRAGYPVVRPPHTHIYIQRVVASNPATPSALPNGHREQSAGDACSTVVVSSTRMDYRFHTLPCLGTVRSLPG